MDNDPKWTKELERLQRENKRMREFIIWVFNRPHLQESVNELDEWILRKADNILQKIDSERDSNTIEFDISAIHSDDRSQWYCKPYATNRDMFVLFMIAGNNQTGITTWYLSENGGYIRSDLYAKKFTKQEAFAKVNELNNQ